MTAHTKAGSALKASAVFIGLGLVGFLAATPAMAGCASFTPGIAPPAAWKSSQAAPNRNGLRNLPALVPVAYFDDRALIRVSDDGGQHGNWGGSGNAGIVGLWKFTFVLDGSSADTYFDFGTVIWHADGTEVTVSGGRAPSSGDICMGAWKQTGPNTYKLNHLALAWVSEDSPPAAGGPVTPAQFVGPAIETQTVTLSRSGNSFDGRFTLDQYQKDGIQLIQHFAGTVHATRITAD